MITIRNAAIIAVALVFAAPKLAAAQPETTPTEQTRCVVSGAHQGYQATAKPGYTLPDPCRAKRIRPQCNGDLQLGGCPAVHEIRLGPKPQRKDVE